MGLTAKQRQFVGEYLVDLNATQAAARAGYSRKNAMRIGYQLLQRSDVQKAVQAAMGERERRTIITQDWVLQELARVAFGSGADYAKVVVDGTEAHVEPISTDKLSGDQRAAIASIEETKFGIKVSSYDKVRALELLGKHLGLFDGKGGGTEMGVQIIDDI